MGDEYALIRLDPLSPKVPKSPIGMNCSAEAERSDKAFAKPLNLRTSSCALPRCEMPCSVDSL